MPRVRELGIYESDLKTGRYNAITDVPGVLVGHATVHEGEGVLVRGSGPYRTGVTVVLPHGGNLYEEKVAGAVETINGYGKLLGAEQVRETGTIETPIALTGTLNVPRVADALISASIEQNRYIGVGFDHEGRQGYATVNPLVGECNDGYLSDLHGRPVGTRDVERALREASSGVVAEGSVGAGAGTSCFGWKGGIGSASRLVRLGPESFVVGTIVQSNFGTPEELVIRGVPVGRYLQPPSHTARQDRGSIMVILATDAPLDSRQLSRLSRRVPYGLALTGSHCHAGSGEFVIAFSTTYLIPDRPDRVIVERRTLANEQSIIGLLGRAVIEAVEEAVLNSLFAAQTVVGRDNHVRHAVDSAAVIDVMARYRGFTSPLNL